MLIDDLGAETDHFVTGIIYCHIINNKTCNDNRRSRGEDDFFGRFFHVARVDNALSYNVEGVSLVRCHRWNNKPHNGVAHNANRVHRQFFYIAVLARQFSAQEFNVGSAIDGQEEEFRGVVAGVL